MERATESARYGQAGVGPSWIPGSSVCIGDFWAASEGLDDLIVRIGRMIAYQEYNTKSPLNGLAAKWAAEHTNLLPVDTRSVSPPSETPAGTAPSCGEPAATSAPDPWEQRIVIEPNASE